MKGTLVSIAILLISLLPPAVKVCAQEAPCISLSVEFIGMTGEWEQMPDGSRWYGRTRTDFYVDAWRGGKWVQSIWSGDFETVSQTGSVSTILGDSFSLVAYCNYYSDYDSCANQTYKTRVELSIKAIPVMVSGRQYGSALLVEVTGAGTSWRKCTGCVHSECVCSPEDCLQFYAERLYSLTDWSDGFLFPEQNSEGVGSPLEPHGNRAVLVFDTSAENGSDALCAFRLRIDARGSWGTAEYQITLKACSTSSASLLD